MQLPLVDRLWCVRGALPLNPPLSAPEAFARLEDLFREIGTTFEIDRETLTFTKKSPSAQDRMAIYGRGRLGVVDGRELIYELSSPTLLFCFLLPFFFLLVAWLMEESRTPGFVFAGIFAVLYIVGRILEPRLIRAAFRKRLAGEDRKRDEFPLAG